jgi:hypothetical protein
LAVVSISLSRFGCKKTREKERPAAYKERLDSWAVEEFIRFIVSLEFTPFVRSLLDCSPSDPKLPHSQPVPSTLPLKAIDPTTVSIPGMKEAEKLTSLTSLHD